MEEKKHIDRLFQEKLKDFEAVPNDHVWKQIEQRLAKKKRRRIVPLWLRLGSTAAILLLLVTSGFWYFDQEDALPNPVNAVPAIGNEKISEPNNKTSNDQIISDIKSESTKPVQEEDTSLQQENTNAVANQTKETVIIPKNVNKANEVLFQHEVNRENFMAQNDKVEKTTETTEKTNREGTLQKEERVNEFKNQESDALVENKTTNKNDLLLTKDDIANAIEDQLDEDKVLDTKLKKWSVGTTIAPVYFNSLSDGSPINASLANNDKVTNASLSYGVKVNYRINDRLSLQSGVNSVELAYKTQGVTALITSSELQQLSGTNIDTNISDISLIAISNNQIASQSSELNSQRGVLNLRGDLNQSLSYIEIPVEAKYALLNKKFGIHLVGGLSTYMLYKNQVSLLDQNGSTTLGEASNINDINFSGNLGLDFDYKLGKKLFINVSPMFKYQMNTFSKNDGGFKPYYLGLYTGLNFRF